MNYIQENKVTTCYCHRAQLNQICMSLVRRRGNYAILKKQCLQESSGETSSDEETSDLVGSSSAGELVGGSSLGVSSSSADGAVDSGCWAMDSGAGV